MSDNEKERQPLTSFRAALSGLLGLNQHQESKAADRERDYRSGYEAGYKKAKEESAAGATSRLASPEEPKAGVLKIEDSRQITPLRMHLSDCLLPSAPLAISPDTIKAFKADTAVRLGERFQPTENQWQAILTPANSAMTIGIAGTGKTFVMMMRVLLMHAYLDIPLDRITIITVTKDCRFELIDELSELFAKWGITISQEQGQKLVRTPRGVLVDVLSGISPLRDVVPFELHGLLQKGDVDGQPFDPRLTKEQIEILQAAYRHAFGKDAEFRKSVIALYRESATLAMPARDNPKLKEYAEKGVEQLSQDEAITRAGTSLWHAEQQWPLDGLEAKLCSIEVLGYQIWTNGYVKELDAYIVLGFPRGGDHQHYRSGAAVPLQAEYLAKRAFIQLYCPGKIIWIQHPEHAQRIIESIQKINNDEAPQFRCRTTGQNAPADVAVSMFRVGSLIENLGLEPAKAISSLSFPANVADFTFYESLARFWPHFEAYLWSNPAPRMVTLNRLFRMFSTESQNNLNGVPADQLRSLQHILTDEFQDISVTIGEFIKACMRENHRRFEERLIDAKTLSIFACGDDFQTAHGTQGATPTYLLEFKRHFPAKHIKVNLLDMNFRSSPGIIRSAHSLITGIPSISSLAPSGVTLEKGDSQVELYDLNAMSFMRLFDLHYGAGDTILILAASPQDYKRSEEFVQIVVERDKLENKSDRLVRVRAVGRSKGLEADVVFLLGDLTAMNSSWALNRLFKIAKTIETQDQSTFDLIQQNELLRLAHIGITRAKQKCYWLLPEQPDLPGLKASSRIASVRDYFSDHREHRA